MNIKRVIREELSDMDFISTPIDYGEVIWDVELLKSTLRISYLDMIVGKTREIEYRLIGEQQFGDSRDRIRLEREYDSKMLYNYTYEEVVEYINSGEWKIIGNTPKETIREEVDNDWDFMGDSEDDLTVESIGDLLKDSEIVVMSQHRTKYNLIDSSNYRKGNAQITIYNTDDGYYNYYSGYYYSQVLDYLEDGSWKIIDIVPLKNHKHRENGTPIN